MLRRLGIITTILSSILLSAHFLRSGFYLGSAISLGIPLLLLIKTTWATRLVQGYLLLAAVIWVNTLLTLAANRQAAGKPWTRMAIILGIVAGLASLSAILLHTKRKPKMPSDALQNDS